VVVVVVVVVVGRVVVVALGKVSSSIPLPQSTVAPSFASVVIQRAPVETLDPNFERKTTSICLFDDPASILCSAYSQLDVAQNW